MENKDIISEITRHIQEGSTWKSWILVCYDIYYISLRFPEKKIKLCNHLWSLIQKFPDKPELISLQLNPPLTDLLMAPCVYSV